MSHWRRWVRFNLVGAMGVVVQLGVVWLLVGRAGLGVAGATAAGVAAAVIHNFLWHRQWTWADRRAHARPLASFGKFALANGAISLVGNVAITAGLVAAGAPIIPANVAAIVVCGLLNYVAGDALVFPDRTAGRREPHVKRGAART